MCDSPLVIGDDVREVSAGNENAASNNEADHIAIDTSTLVANGAASEAAEGCSTGTSDVTFPPMPEPRKSEMRGEAIGGIICVSIIIAGQLAFGHVVVVMIGDTSLIVSIIFLALMYLDAMLALYCLVMILNGDPGVVSRCPEVNART